MNDTAIVTRQAPPTVGLDLGEIRSTAKLTVLTQKTPRNEVKYREGRGGQRFPYVEHSYVTELLNNAFDWNWDFEVLSEQVLDNEVVVRCRLTVRPAPGVVIAKEQYGGADIKRFTQGSRSGMTMSIADDLKAAASDALKKCASLLGIALDLYGRDYPEADSAEPVKAGAHGTNLQQQAPRQVEANPKRAAFGTAFNQKVKALRLSTGERDRLIVAVTGKKTVVEAPDEEVEALATVISRFNSKQDVDTFLLREEGSPTYKGVRAPEQEPIFSD